MRRTERKTVLARLVWRDRDGSAPPIGELIPEEAVFPAGRIAPPQGRLILGDNLRVMGALLPEYQGRIRLIYADPPFRSGKAYAARVGRNEDSRRPDTWRTTAGYEDRWPDGPAYLNMLEARLRLMHRLLSPDGTLYLHLDWHSAAYARVLLDEIFGPERLLNEIVWVYHGPSPIRSAFKRKHDTILVYTKSRRYVFHADAVRVPYDPATWQTFAASARAGFGKLPDLRRGKVPEDWWYFPVVARLHRERTGYPTQKPEALLERVILASSEPGDLVADFFCGSGTAPVVAGRLGRRWLACDSAPLAVHTTHRRLLLGPDPAPFCLFREAGHAFARLRAPPRVRLRASSEGIALGLQEQPVRRGSGVRVDLMEVDPDADGRLFQSRLQAVRPWRSDQALEVALPGLPAGPVAVRLVDNLGRAAVVRTGDRGVGDRG